jgi:DNA topoisomerase-6 subunit B
MAKGTSASKHKSSAAADENQPSLFADATGSEQESAERAQRSSATTTKAVKVKSATSASAEKALKAGKSKGTPSGDKAEPTLLESVASDEGAEDDLEQAEAEVVADVAPKKKKKLEAYATAESMAQKQREISISEFFAKNRHLLGFDNPKKALLTTIKEAVDNSLDACEEAGIMPNIKVIVKQLAEDRFEVTVDDNGPGIMKHQIPNVFGKLLYGSKFHHLKMSRGQQGIGISAAGMYGLLTTGKAIRVTSRTSAGKPAHYYELQIDTKKNRPDIIREAEVEFDHDHGTCVTIELEARYQKGRTSIDEYLRQTAIANPHAEFSFVTPEGETIVFKHTATELPPQVKAIKPHPYGVELGVLIKMLNETQEKTLTTFLTNEFSRVSTRVAEAIAKAAKVSASAKPATIGRNDADKLFQAIKQVKIMAPSTDCVVPIGEENLLKGLQAVVKAEFYAAHTRPPAVYRGNPFIIEAALAYGKPTDDAPGGEAADDELELGKVDGQIEIGDNNEGELMRVFRVANRVPLLYQQSACATYKAIVTTTWRNYGLSQSRGALPAGPVVMILHIASVWVPFTSESKEAVAHYPEIIKEMKLAIQECGRKLSRHLKREKRVRDELKKRSYIEKYIPHIGIALKDILGLTDAKRDHIVAELKDILEKSRTL